jgi:hypothetical protein
MQRLFESILIMHQVFLCSFVFWHTILEIVLIMTLSSFRTSVDTSLKHCFKRRIRNALKLLSRVQPRSPSKQCFGCVQNYETSAVLFRQLHDSVNFVTVALDYFWLSLLVRYHHIFHHSKQLSLTYIQKSADVGWFIKCSHDIGAERKTLARRRIHKMSWLNLVCVMFRTESNSRCALR